MTAAAIDADRRNTRDARGDRLGINLRRLGGIHAQQPVECREELADDVLGAAEAEFGVLDEGGADEAEFVGRILGDSDGDLLDRILDRRERSLGR